MPFKFLLIFVYSSVFDLIPGFTIRRSTSLSPSGVPYAYEPKRMIFCGCEVATIRSAICLISLSKQSDLKFNRIILRLLQPYW